ncbi:Unannotated [Lentimonas sp. CC19]|nr:Unannotated [Lentimonas sp. CC19]CAA6697358.1 Unannotated [Lentimonas sp. CC10]CAA7072357.1 Unannotated [Lentimonas sp. CC11]
MFYSDLFFALYGMHEGSKQVEACAPRAIRNLGSIDGTLTNKVQWTCRIRCPSYVINKKPIERPLRTGVVLNPLKQRIVATTHRNGENPSQSCKQRVGSMLWNRH